MKSSLSVIPFWIVIKDQESNWVTQTKENPHYCGVTSRKLSHLSKRSVKIMDPYHSCAVAINYLVKRLSPLRCKIWVSLKIGSKNMTLSVRGTLLDKGIITCSHKILDLRAINLSLKGKAKVSMQAVVVKAECKKNRQRKALFTIII